MQFPKHNYHIINEFIIVIVLYKQSLLESDSFISLTANLDPLETKADLLVYDNSPSSILPTKESFTKWNITYIHDSANPGVSRAYNEGFRIGKNLNKQWLLLIDQDTYFPVNSLSAYLAAIQAYPQESLFVPILKSGDIIVSPSKYVLKRGFHLKAIKPGLHSLSSTSPINSGMCIRTTVFEAVGGYNEKVKLDFSDFAFIDRLRNHIKSFVVIDLVCKHKFSGTENHTLENSLKRFSYYCDGAKHSIDSLSSAAILFVVVFVRMIKLNIKFKTWQFVKPFLKYFF